jgi:hypothetical protein
MSNLKLDVFTTDIGPIHAEDTQHWVEKLLGI